jgi:uncharacterized MAPEG superfamily protein
MSLELTLLAWSCLLALIYLSAQALLYKAQVGNRATVGARDTMPRAEKLAGRAQRAFANFLETFPIFVALVLLVEIGGLSDALTQWGAGLYLTMRVIYLPLYLSGIAWVRTISWNIATLGLALMLLGVLL